MKFIINKSNIKDNLTLMMFFSYIYNPTRKYFKLRYMEYTSEHTNLQAQSSINSLKFPMPKLNKICVAYTHMSNLTHYFGLMHSSLLILFYEGSFKMKDKAKLFCYLPGRVTLHEAAVPLLPLFALMTNFLHILWRYFAIIYKGTYRLDCIPFLLIGQDGIKRQFKVDFGKSNLESYTTLGLKSPSKNFLKDILYLRIEFLDKKCRYYLRPNRTLVALEQLNNFMSTLTLYNAIVFVIIWSCILPNILRTSISDKFYIKNYPTCSPKLEELEANGELSFWSASYLPPNHRLYVFPGDVIINLVIYLDNFVGLLCPAMISILLTKDLLIYWKHIREKLDSLLVNMKVEHANTKLSKYSDSSQLTYLNETNSWNRINRRYSNYYGTDFAEYQYNHHNFEIDERTYILQQQTIDFFKQLKYYDKFVSLLVSYLFLIWISMWITTTYMTLKISNFTGLIVIRIIQFYGGLALSIPLGFLLELTRCTKDAYTILCSIMAYEKQLQRKRCWSNILEFYTKNSGYGFTTIQSNNLSWMTYFKVMATSLSFLVVVETLSRYQ